MLSSSGKIQGQGVDSAYLELVRMLKQDASNELMIRTNSYKRADVTHYHTINLLYYFSTFFKRHVGKRIGYVHFLPETLDGSIKLPKPIFSIFKKYVLSFYKRMDQLVVVNPDFIDKLAASGIKCEKVSYIPNFVSKEKWYELSFEDKNKFREELAIDKDKFIIIGVGQIQKRKGIDDFIALAQKNPEIQFIWVGGFSFGKISDGYEDYKKKVDNPPNNLLFTGIVFREKMINYYNIADLFLLPSFNELFPMSILEAASTATPIMLRNLELYRSILMENYIAANDLENMNEKLREILQNRDILVEYEKCANKISKLYSEESLCKTWKDFYLSVT
jgi:1,2-diacylglycerol-3-alpha-glucose alpha-1,2-galactosyltransferase